VLRKLCLQPSSEITRSTEMGSHFFLLEPRLQQDPICSFVKVRVWQNNGESSLCKSRNIQKCQTLPNQYHEPWNAGSVVGIKVTSPGKGIVLPPRESQTPYT